MALSRSQHATVVSCIAYKYIWDPSDAHQRHLGEGSLKGEDRKEENEEI